MSTPTPRLDVLRAMREAQFKNAPRVTAPQPEDDQMAKKAKRRKGSARGSGSGRVVAPAFGPGPAKKNQVNEDSMVENSTACRLRDKAMGQSR